MREDSKVVIDTNIFVSALIGKGAVMSQIYEAFIDGKFTPVLSLLMHLEILEVINRPKVNKYFKVGEVERLKELLNTDTIFVTPLREVKGCRDPKDNILLAAALEGKVDSIVSGDQDLLTLKTFRHIPIISPRDFLKQLSKS